MSTSIDNMKHLLMVSCYAEHSYLTEKLLVPSEHIIVFSTVKENGYLSYPLKDQITIDLCITIERRLLEKIYPNLFIQDDRIFDQQVELIKFAGINKLFCLHVTDTSL